MAANRLHFALRDYDVESYLLVQEIINGGDNIVPADKGPLSKSRMTVRSAVDHLAHFAYGRNSVVSPAFSPATTGIDISQHELIRNADIIHLHHTGEGYLSLEGLKKLFNLGKPVVWTLHDMWPFTGGCHYSGTCLEFLERCSFCQYLKNPSKRDMSTKQFVMKKSIYHNADLHLVACSKWIRALSSESSLLRDKEVAVIPNPIDVDIFKPGDKRESRKKLGLPQDKLLLLFDAEEASDMRKGARYLVEALKILVDSFPVFKEKVEIMVFGKISGRDREAIPVNIHNLKHGDTRRMISIYTAADIFVLPSLQDNFPNAVLESMACGTPVVAFSTGGIPEMIRHHHNGFLAESKNALNLSTGIYETLFLSDIEKMGINARKKVLEEYAGDIVASKYLKLYESLVK